MFFRTICLFICSALCIRLMAQRPSAAELARMKKLMQESLKKANMSNGSVAAEGEEMEEGVVWGKLPVKNTVRLARIPKQPITEAALRTSISAMQAKWLTHVTSENRVLANQLIEKAQQDPVLISRS